MRQITDAVGLGFDTLFRDIRKIQQGKGEQPFVLFYVELWVM